MSGVCACLYAASRSRRCSSNLLPVARSPVHTGVSLPTARPPSARYSPISTQLSPVIVSVWNPGPHLRRTRAALSQGPVAHARDRPFPVDSCRLVLRIPSFAPALPGGTPSMVSCAPRTTASAAPTTHASRRGCAAVASLVQSGERRSQSTMQPSPVASGPPSDGNLLDGRHLEEKLDIITHEPLARVRHRAP